MSDDAVLARLRERLEHLNHGDTVDVVEFRALVELYASLVHKFDKVLAISDKYQRLLETVATGGTPGSGDSHPRTGSAGRSREALSPTVEGLVQRLREHPDEDVAKLVNRFVKLQAQLTKIMSISDVYQSQLRETTLKLEKMARTDVLTELSNRRDMTEHLDMESARSARSGRTFGIILFDIDHFKSVNDKHGHEAGDAVLVAVGEVFRSVLRSTDLCARWGGEEFLILCPETDLGQTAAVAEKCRCSVETTVIPIAEKALQVTVSGGVSAMSPHCDWDWELLVREADAALYQAKTTGRNKVETGAVGCA
jgi:diguanylate cyclase